MDKVSEIPALSSSCLLGKGRVEGIQDLWDGEIGEKIRKSLLVKG